ncbi:MAG TPA: SusC/RagA family TonB-linked outer membrane protein [Gemmatimonadales bacterium]|nr:SusC/RagA family TonB-linked outer membrane protein [Gemmatimonadales bacterium]
MKQSLFEQLRVSRSWLLTIVAAVALLPGRMLAQQPATLTGKVTSESGQPLASAGVIIEQLSAGAVTRPDGSYTIIVPGARVPSGPVTVTARLVGYKARSAQVNLGTGSAVQDFTLADNPLQLGELVVTGAGTVSEVEKLGTGRSSVDSLSIVRSNEQNVVNALAAKAPNVEVTSSSGDPGASSFIQVRGLTTITAQDGQPLFVVDGVPIDNTITYNNIANGALNSSASPSNRAIDINPGDIENVEILKGAASGAIYGSRAGQGVILITTKRGRPGPTRYSLRSSVSLNRAGRLPEFQDKYGLGSGGVTPACVPGAAVGCFVGFPTAASWGPDLTLTGAPTFDHSDEMLQDGYGTDNTLTISGGNDRTTFFLSGGYNYDRGIIVGPSNYYQRIAVRFNGSHRVFDNLKIGANVAYTDGDGSAVVSRNSTDGLLLGAWRTPPDFNNLPYLDPTNGQHRSYRFPNPGPGNEKGTRGYDNPFFVANEAPANSKVGRTFGGVNAEFSATRWLAFNYTLGLDYANDERTQGYPWQNSNTTITGVNGVGGVNAGYIATTQLDHNLTATAQYKLSPSWSGSITIGQNLNSQSYQTRQTLGTDLIAPQPFNLANTAQQLPPYDFKQTVRLESYFAQATADLFDQLFLTAALRNDGASSFGLDNRRNWFPKGSAAWTFFRGEQGANRFLTFGKLRAAYGESGTQPAPYLLQSVLVSGAITDGGWGPAGSTQQGGVGGLISRYNVPTTELGPERVKEFETGFDLGLWQDKADLGLTYYRQNSTDVILNIPVAGSSGYTEKPANAASLRNIGVEVALNVRPITTRDFAWDLGLQWSQNRSMVTDLAGVQFAPFPFSGGTNGLGIQGVAVEGQPLGVYYGTDYVRCGRGLTVNNVNIDNTAGECLGEPSGALYIDTSGYAQLDAAGAYVLADPNPRWIGSVRTSFRVKKFSLGGLLDIRHGGKAYNGTRGAMNHFGTSKESQVYRDGGTFVFGQTYLDDQTVAGPGVGKAVPLAEAWFTGPGGIFNGPVSAFTEDAGFVKLREISLGYTFDEPWVSRVLGFGSMDLRIAGRNLVTWTDYTGVDPETSLLGSATAVRGIDYFNNPQGRSYVFSITLNR